VASVIATISMNGCPPERVLSGKASTAT